MIRVAILVDEGYYRKRANRLFGQKTAAERATELEEYCKKHLLQDKTGTYLYRIFYYDYPPCDKNIYHPFLQRNINLKKSDLYTWMNTFLNELKSTRKFALRMGRLSSNDTGYIIKPEKMKALCANKISFSDITLKKQVDQIILIAGDSDFVPSAKLTRREGVDFILEPMGQTINDDLNEHIDGIRSKIKYFIPKEQ